MNDLSMQLRELNKNFGTEYSDDDEEDVDDDTTTEEEEPFEDDDTANEEEVQIDYPPWKEVGRNVLMGFRFQGKVRFYPGQITSRNATNDTWHFVFEDGDEHDITTQHLEKMLEEDTLFIVPPAQQQPPESSTEEQPLPKNNNSSSVPVRFIVAYTAAVARRSKKHNATSTEEDKEETRLAKRPKTHGTSDP